MNGYKLLEREYDVEILQPLGCADDERRGTTSTLTNTYYDVKWGNDKSGHVWGWLYTDDCRIKLMYSMFDVMPGCVL